MHRDPEQLTIARKLDCCTRVVNELGFTVKSSIYWRLPTEPDYCKNIPRYELFRKLKTTDPDKFSERQAQCRRLTSDALIDPNNVYSCLSLLGIRPFHDKLDYLNTVRIVIYHASAEKAEAGRQNGDIEVEKIEYLTDGLAMPIITFKVYAIMFDLIDFFYSKQKALEYWKEGVAYWKCKRRIWENV